MEGVELFVYVVLEQEDYCGAFVVGVYLNESDAQAAVEEFSWARSYSRQKVK